MNNPRTGRRPATRATKSERSSAGRRALKWIAGVAFLLVAAVTAWGYLPDRQDPGVARIQELREQMEGADDEQRRELYREMRETYRSLPEEERDQLNEDRRRRWEAREQKFYNEFFAMTPDEQTKKLDEQIKESEERYKRWAQRRAQQAGDRGARDGRRGGRGRGRGSRDSLERRKRYLDRTSPVTRAQRSEYRRMRAARRQALGLPERRRR